LLVVDFLSRVFDPFGKKEISKYAVFVATLKLSIPGVALGVCRTHQAESHHEKLP